MGYQTGLSGLQAASNDLNVIGNNIANSNTVGFKEGRAEFADLYANSIYGASDNQIGIGVTMTTVQQDFSNGSLTATTQPLDMAIDGNGFFQISNNGSLAYSRDGEFHKSDTNIIVNAQNQPLMGYLANANGVIDTSKTVPLSLGGVANVPPLPTANAQVSFNVSPTDTTPTVTPFDPTNPLTYNTTTGVTVYDSQGQSHTANIYLVKGAAAGQWDAYVSMADAATPVGTGAGSSFTSLGTVNFNSSGTLTGASSFSFNMLPSNGSTSPQVINVNLAGTTQYGTQYGKQDTATNATADGYTAGTLKQFSVGADGKISGSYTNGVVQTVAQVALASFKNPNGLVDLGNNLYEQTQASGQAQIDAPGTTDHGTLLGSTLEQSNVDLTTQLVDLITAQRNYQANAQTIKTQQTVDQAIINI
ncbi:flagellar hook protein FlgE [Paraburkholderia sediminicola]|uniref:flagellar hook protein FlgE n=1 Tax=Paraburkholderia sediminicola TaxID=458836 RepID=UPI0038BB3487